MKIENFFCDPQSIISDVETTLILEMLISVATWPYCGKQTNFFSKNLKFWKLQLQPEISMGQPSKTNKNWLFCVILKIWSRLSLFFTQKASKLRIPSWNGHIKMHQTRFFRSIFYVNVKFRILAKKRVFSKTSIILPKYISRKNLTKTFLIERENLHLTHAGDNSADEFRLKFIFGRAKKSFWYHFVKKFPRTNLML